MNPDDPIHQLEAHYRRLHDVSVPNLQVRRAVHWWEAAGGLAAGVAAVMLVVSLTISGPEPSLRGPSPLLQSQMRSAGLVDGTAAHPRRAEREGPWHA